MTSAAAAAATFEVHKAHGAKQFQLWQPGAICAVRRYLVSEHFQSATQLAAGVLFVSLFVFVDALRFPGSCLAVLLYFVVAVTAAVDCHVGTRIFLCGFMIGPMWLSLLIGGIISTLGKLAPTKEGELIVLCILGPAALVPFAINRVSSGYIYLWAMGMISCLYLGMPILTGWAAPDVRTVWERAVGFVLVAALIGMFAGSVLSMIVLPSLASHKLEDEVSAALKKLGHHLSAAASQLWRPGKSSMQALPDHLQGLHPLLFPGNQEAEPGVMAPGLLDRDLGGVQVSPRHVYVAAMDWFEHLSRPPDMPHSKSCFSGLRCSRSVSSSDGARSELQKSTFYGRSAGSMAAAVAAAAQDSGLEEAWLQGSHAQLQQRDGNSCWGGDAPLTADIRPLSSFVVSKPGNTLEGARQQTLSMSRGPSGLKLGSTVTAASVRAAKADAAHMPPYTTNGSNPEGRRREAASSSSMHRGHTGSAGGNGTIRQPSPTISEVRQLLAHANQLLDAAAAEPQWLRAGERRFDIAAWRKLVPVAQLVATRLTALDLIQRDFVSLSEEAHSFPVADKLSELLIQLYGAGAAALALLSEQIRHREQLGTSCEASQQILKSPEWHDGKKRLLGLLEGTLAYYYLRLQQASPEAPVTVPSAHWVRRWMFFHTTTLSVIDALDALAAVSRAAFAAPPQQSRRWWQIWRQQPQQEPQDGVAGSPTRCDIEAGTHSDAVQEARTDDQHKSSSSSSAATPAAAAMAGATPATLSAAEQPAPALLDSLTSVRLTGEAAAAVSAAVGAADAAAAVPPQGAAAGPLGAAQLPLQHQQQPPLQQQQQPLLSPAGQSPAAPAAGGAAAQPVVVKSSFQRHTAWMRPWLPLAFNVKQYENLQQFVTQDLPAAFSSQQGFKAAMHNRRVHACIKYWCVIVIMLVGTLLLQYFVPASVRLGPSFGYTAAVVGMSDRVESTVFKVVLWSGATIVGAFLGWALMTHPAMAFNSLALGAVMCAVAFLVGNMERGPDKGNSLFTLFTLTTLASIVLCQCCHHLGSTLVSVTRGGTVLVAAIIAVTVQNLILPWYTSTWALEQLGLVFKEATEVLADLICQLYEDTDELMQQQQQQQQQHQQQEEGGSVKTATTRAGAGLSDKQQPRPNRLQLLDEAVRRVLLREQQAAAGAVDGAAAAGTAAVLTSDGQAAAALSAPLSPDAFGQCAAVSQTNGTTPSSPGANSSGGAFSRPPCSHVGELQQLLQQRRLKHQQQQQQDQAPTRINVTGLQLQSRLVRPLVQIKISLILDTTAWRSGLLATPKLVLNMVSTVFDLVDALAALQQAVSMPVKQLSGSWDWTLMHTAGAFAALLLQTMQLADATAQHTVAPSPQSAAKLLNEIQEVQHKRFEYFAVQRNLRRLLHTVMATDEEVLGNMGDVNEWQLQGHLRYSACVYATSKVLDRITATARCALTQ